MAAPATHSGGIRVDGLAQMQRAFAVADKTLATEMRKGLRDAAEPVKASAQTNAADFLDGPRSDGAQDWRAMRVGVTRTLVYVAPKARSTRSTRKRRNLFDMIAGRALEPALDDNVGEVERRLDQVLATVGSAWERA